MTPPASKAVSFIFIGGFGNCMFRPIQDQLLELDVAKSILCIGICDLGRRYHKHNANLQIHMGMPNLSPDRDEIDKSLALGQGSQRRVIAYETLLEMLTTRLIRAYKRAKTEPAPLIFLVSKHCLAFMRPVLEKIKSQFPQCTILLVTCVVQSDLRNERTQHEVREVQTLYENGLVEKVIVVDEMSAFASGNSKEEQLKFLSHALVSLLLMHQHSNEARSFNDLLKDIHIPFQLSPFASFAFASVSLSVSRRSPRTYQDVVDELTGAYVCRDKNISQKVQEAAKLCIEDQSCTAFPVTVDSTLPGLLVATVPLPQSDKQFSGINSSLRGFVQSNYPCINSAVVSCNQSWFLNSLGNPNYVDTALLYQLPNLL